MNADELLLIELVAEASAAVQDYESGRCTGAEALGLLVDLRGALSAAVGGHCEDESYADACEVIATIDSIFDRPRAGRFDAVQLERRAS